MKWVYLHITELNSQIKQSMDFLLEIIFLLIPQAVILATKQTIHPSYFEFLQYRDLILSAFRTRISSTFFRK